MSEPVSDDMVALVSFLVQLTFTGTYDELDLCGCHVTLFNLDKFILFILRLLYEIHE